jgi:hypothetical protein
MPLAPFSRRGLVFMFGSENIFFAPLKIMTNQKSPAHLWARFSGHGPLVMKSSAKDAGSASASFAPIYVVDRPCPEKRAKKMRWGFLSSLHCYFRCTFFCSKHIIPKVLSLHVCMNLTVLYLYTNLYV